MARVVMLVVFVLLFMIVELRAAVTVILDDGPQVKVTNSAGGFYDFFGVAVSISGTSVLVGARRDDVVGYLRGAAFIFTEETPGAWTQKATLTADDAAENDNFGTSVALSGTNALVGATMTDIMSPGNGKAFIFSETVPGVWSQVAKLTAGDGAASDWFGVSVAISGTTALVGAMNNDAVGSDSGAAYLFSEISSGVWSQVAQLTAGDPAAISK